MSDKILGIALLLFSCWLWWEAFSYPFSSRILPLSLSIVIGLLSILLISKKQIATIKKISIKKLLPFILVMIFTILLMDFVGFFVALIFLVSFGMIIQKHRNLKSIVINSIAFSILSYLFFVKFLGLPLPVVWK